jgi:hypothetical protein
LCFGRAGTRPSGRDRIVAPYRIDQRADLVAQLLPDGRAFRPVLFENVVELADVGRQPADRSAGVLERGPRRGEQQGQHEGGERRDQSRRQADHFLGIAGQMMLGQSRAHDRS